MSITEAKNKSANETFWFEYTVFDRIYLRSAMSNISAIMVSVFLLKNCRFVFCFGLDGFLSAYGLHSVAEVEVVCY